MKMKDLLNTDVLRESSVTRIWQHIEDDSTFGIISAERWDLSKEKNDSRTFQLRHDIRALKLGYIKLIGTFTEKDKETGEEKTTSEVSLFVGGITKEDTLRLGAKYNQYSVIYKDSEVFGQFSTDGNLIEKYASKDGSGNLELKPEQLKKAFSALANGSHKKKPWSFKLQEEQGEYFLHAAYSPNKPLIVYDAFYEEIGEN